MKSKNAAQRSVAWIATMVVFVLPALAQTRYPDTRGLLASSGFEGQPVKGVYFFPGETRDSSVYTAHPSMLSDQEWNSAPTSLTAVVKRMIRAHVNTIVMSYWGDMVQWSPMAIDRSTLSGLLEAVQNAPILVMPAIEVGNDPRNPR